MITINTHLVLLKEKYKDKIYANKKSPLEIMNYLGNKFNVQEVEKNSGKYQRQIELTKINCSNAESYKNKIKYEDMNILTYEIIKDERSIQYYQNYNQNNFPMPPIPPILVMIETNTGYLYSNCNELLEHLIIYQGISQEDIDNNTGDLSLYLRLIDETENRNS